MAEASLEEIIGDLELLIHSIKHHREPLSDDKFQSTVFMMLHVMLTVVKDIRDGH